MKIVKLVAENVKRLHAIEITPEGTLVTIGGKNGAGKSSVLDSIAYAMGGEKLVPSEPIRAGESAARVVVDLGDLVVTRRFKRTLVHQEGCTIGTDVTSHGSTVRPEVLPCNCTPSWSETASTLTVTNKEGARYPSPQAVLDKLLGKLTFDPLAFARMDPKPQDEVLRKLVGVDVAPLEARRKEAFDHRAMLKKTHGIKEAQVLAMPHHKDAPTEEVSIAEISQRMQKAEEYRRLAEEAERDVDKTRTIVTEVESRKAVLLAKQEELKKQIDALQVEVGNCQVKLDLEQRTLDAHQITAQAARAVVPDTSAIRQQLDEAEAANVKVRANKRRWEALEACAEVLRDVEAQQGVIDAAEADKRRVLSEAKFPVPGLGLSDDGVTFNDLPFAQAGSAEQVRVSVAIGIALNPQLKVLLIRNGNLLDDDSLKAVAAQAEEAGMQVWMEYVSASKDGVAVMMVDGEVA